MWLAASEAKNATRLATCSELPGSTICKRNAAFGKLNGFFNLVNMASLGGFVNLGTDRTWTDGVDANFVLG